MHVGSTPGYYRQVNFDQKLSIGNQDGGFTFRGRAAAWGGATWIALTMSHFSTIQTMEVAVE